MNKIVKLAKLNNKNRIRFLLMNPDSQALERRAKIKQNDLPSRKADILSSIGRLKNLTKNYGIDIEIKLFDQFPNWRLIIIGGSKVYLTFYSIEKEGYNSPMIELNKDINSNDTLFYPINSEFEEVWNFISK